MGRHCRKRGELAEPGKSEVAALADWTMARRGRTPEGAIKALAAAKGIERNAYIEHLGEILPRDGNRWLLRRIVAHVEHEIALRELFAVRKFRRAHKEKATFHFTIRMGGVGRVALGLLMRHAPTFFAGECDREVERTLADCCRKLPAVGHDGFSRAVAAVKFQHNANGNFTGLLTEAPDVLATQLQFAKFHKARRTRHGV